MQNQSSASLFVYGTLMFPEVTEAVTGWKFPQISAKAVGFRRYSLVGRDYPGMVSSSEGSVTGQFITGITRQAMILLDTFEGSEYIRTPVTAILGSGRQVETFSYLWNGKAEDILPAEWDEIDFKTNKLNNFVKRVYQENLVNGQAICGQLDVEKDSPLHSTAAVNTGKKSQRR